MRQTAHWKIISAFLIDFIGSFVIFSTVISKIAGGYTRSIVADNTTINAHFSWPQVIILVVAVVAYFKLMDNNFGGTIGKRIFKIAVKPKANLDDDPTHTQTK